MDGNNRWSLKKKISKINAYKVGAKKLIQISDYLFNKYKISVISAFALSTHNLGRSKKFVNIFKSVLNYYLDEYDNFKITYRIKFIGDLSFIKEKSLLKKLNFIESKNFKSSNTLLIFVNYSGKNDIINAANLSRDNKFKPPYLSNYLSTKSFKDPDLLFRTGGFKRISDFMLFQISFTELFFTKKLWPDISFKDIDKVLASYQKIERKFGL